MDTFAALALATDQATEALLKCKHNSSESVLILNVAISLSSEILVRSQDVEMTTCAKYLSCCNNATEPSWSCPWIARMTRFSKHSWTDSAFLKSAVLSLILRLAAHPTCSQSQGAGSIAQLTDSEFDFIPSSPYQPSSPPISDIAHDTPSVLPYGSPMSERPHHHCRWTQRLTMSRWQRKAHRSWVARAHRFQIPLWR
jgi:hypothetical protein